MGRTKFGVLDGKTIDRYVLKNNSIEVGILTLGGIVQSIKVPDKNHTLVDVVLGYDTVEEYINNTCFFGGIIGRNANRIAKGKCTIDGVTYELEQNNYDSNHHSGKNGFQNVIWNVKEADEKRIVLSYFSREFEQGFPGNMEVEVMYYLGDNNDLVISYHATTDKTTVANMTNHSYFNLNGHDSGDVENHLVMIKGSYFTPVEDYKSIPTGERLDVCDTPMEFRKFKPIGEDINMDYSQLEIAKGYDHNYCIDSFDKTKRLAARALGDKTGIMLNVYTDCPGVHFYTGNYIPEHKGKHGAVYGFRHGFCMETQYYPNSVNEPNFLSPLITPDKAYDSVTVFEFETM